MLCNKKINEMVTPPLNQMGQYAIINLVEISYIERSEILTQPILMTHCCLVDPTLPVDACQ